jgi:hypothetical protein
MKEKAVNRLPVRYKIGAFLVTASIIGWADRINPRPLSHL